MTSPSGALPTGQPTMDQPATDQPTTDQPTTDQPTMDQPTMDQPKLKRALKCGISLFVFFCSEIRKTAMRALGRGTPVRCVVVYYHSVPAAERSLFAEQLNVIQRCGPVIKTDKIGEKNIPAQKKSAMTLAGDRIAITFDDGFENFLTEALPELEKRKMPSTVFAIADGMNREFGSDAYMEKLLSLEQVRNLPADLVTIGSHTLTHPMLPHIPEDEARREIHESKLRLEAMLDRPVTEFSFPFGGFNQRLLEICREAGYERIYTTLPAFAAEKPSESAIGRVRVDPTDWPLEFRLKLAGAYRWLPAIFSWKRKFLLMASRFMAVPPARPSPRAMVR